MDSGGSPARRGPPAAAVPELAVHEELRPAKGGRTLVEEWGGAEPLSSVRIGPATPAASGPACLLQCSLRFEWFLLCSVSLKSWEPFPGVSPEEGPA